MKPSVFAFWVTALLMAGCSRPQALTNEEASLGSGLPYDPLQWRVIASSIDPAQRTTSTLFGNDRAIEYARSELNQTYAAGSLLALVTWELKEDPNWFGANIPGAVKTIEYVAVTLPRNGPLAYEYHRFEGAPLREVQAPETLVKARLDHILRQRPVYMPDAMASSISNSSQILASTNPSHE